MMPSSTTGVETRLSMGFARESVAASEATRVNVKSMIADQCQATEQILYWEVEKLLGHGKTRKA